MAATFFNLSRAKERQILGEGGSIRVQLVCQFGEPVRGVSPYANSLRKELESQPGISLEIEDFKSPYPAVLHPARTIRHRTSARLNWYSPLSWSRVAKSPADILHLQHWAPPLASYLLPLVALAKRTGKKIVITSHNPLPHEHSGVFDGLERQLYKLADVLIVHGEYGKRALIERLGSATPKIVIIPHGMDVSASPILATAENRALAGLDPTYRHLLLFGNLRPYKGVDVLLKAWEIASDKLPDVRLVIAGQLWNGKRRLTARLAGKILGVGNKGDAKNLLAPRSLPRNVVFKEGFLDDSSLDELIKASDVLVFPYNHFSGQSGAACRAGALGKPLLLSKVGALPDLAIDASWLVQPADPAALARALVERLQGNPDMLETGKRQLSAVTSFDWKRVAVAHAEVYRSPS